MRWWQCCRSRWGGIQAWTKEQWFVLWKGWFYTLWVLPHQMLIRLLAPRPWALASFPTHGALLSLCSLLLLYNCHFNTFPFLGAGEGGRGLLLCGVAADWRRTEAPCRAEETGSFPPVQCQSPESMRLSKSARGQGWGEQGFKSQTYHFVVVQFWHVTNILWAWSFLYQIWTSAAHNSESPRELNAAK